MKFKLFGGPADGGTVVTDTSRDGMQTFPFIDVDGATVIYFRLRHCGHVDCPVTFVHPSLQAHLQ